MSTKYKLCACPLDCFDLCSMRAEIIGGKVTKLEGNKEHPITQGFICEKGRKHINPEHWLTAIGAVSPVLKP